jgi:chitin disaccharide deacetylase
MINADDFGFTSGVNRAIIKAQTDGVVTSATLMASGPAFCEATEMAKQWPKLSIGCHLVLIDGKPVLPSARLPSLTQAERFHDNLKTFVAWALTGQFDEAEIAAGATAQIRKVQAAELCVSHLDTHKHTHIFPKVFGPLFAGRCRLRATSRPKSVRSSASFAIESTSEATKSLDRLGRDESVRNAVGKIPQGGAAGRPNNA